MANVQFSFNPYMIREELLCWKEKKLNQKAKKNTYNKTKIGHTWLSHNKKHIIEM